MVCPPATSEAGARWPRFGLVVVATTSRRYNKVQMIRPYIWGARAHRAQRDVVSYVLHIILFSLAHIMHRRRLVPNAGAHLR
jgi:hypothetical protein